jgi:hypothetical protein
MLGPDSQVVSTQEGTVSPFNPAPQGLVDWVEWVGVLVVVWEPVLVGWVDFLVLVPGLGFQTQVSAQEEAGLGLEMARGPTYPVLCPIGSRRKVRITVL